MPHFSSVVIARVHTFFCRSRIIPSHIDSGFRFTLGPQLGWYYCQRGRRGCSDISEVWWLFLPVKITMKKVGHFLLPPPSFARSLLNGDKKRAPEFFFIANFQWFTASVGGGIKRVWIFNAWIIFISDVKKFSRNLELKLMLALSKCWENIQVNWTETLTFFIFSERQWWNFFNCVKNMQNSSIVHYLGFVWMQMILNLCSIFC